MFIELTEIVADGLGRVSNPERKIYVNSSKIQSIPSDSTERTIIEMRRSSIRVKESYEEVKALVG